MNSDRSVDHVEELRALSRSLKDNESSIARLRSMINLQRKLFGESARRFRVKKFGAQSLREIARTLDRSPSFVSDFERGLRWSDSFAIEYFNLLSTSGERDNATHR